MKPLKRFVSLEKSHHDHLTFDCGKPALNQYYPVPVIVLARLVVDRQIQGQSYGDVTLIKAIRHSAIISNTIPAYSLVLDVKDAEARRFYQRYPDFKPLTNNPSRLFLPIKIAQKV